MAFFIRSPNKVIIRQVQNPLQVLEKLGILICQGLGIHAGLLGCVIHLHSMLIRARQKMHVLASKSLKAGNGIGYDEF